MISFEQRLQSHLSKRISLYNFVNPQFAKVLQTIGFDKNFVRAQGVSLFDENGNEYFDFLSGYGVFALGRNHPKVLQGLKELLQMDFPNMLQMEAPLFAGLLAQKLVTLTGHGVRDKVFFTNSGTEAVEGAIKFAKASTKRQKFLYLDHAFHGLSTGSLAVNGNLEFRSKFENLLPGKKILLNDEQSLEFELRTQEYAAFIFEPIQGKGVFLPDVDFIQKAKRLCEQTGTLLIADEIQTGLGRTGRWMACDRYGIEPDIVTFAKALSAGFVPLGALVYTSKIYDDVFSSMEDCVVHSSTFSKNTLAMGCGLMSLDLIEEENLLQNASQQGQALLQGLLKLKDETDWIKDVRGEGLMLAIEFHRPSTLKKQMVWDAVQKMNAGLFAQLIVMRLFSEHHFLTQVSGHHQDILKILPPLILTEELVQKFLNAFSLTLKDSDKVTGPLLNMGMSLAKHVIKNGRS